MAGQSSSRKAYHFPGGMPRSILKLEESSNFNGYPAHIQELLKSPSGVLSTREFLSRLVHVCLVEVGFLPVANLEEDEETIELEGDGSSPFYSQIVNSDYCDSVPRCVLALAKVLKDGGTLQQWKYRAVVMKRWKEDGAPLESERKVRDEDGSQSSSNSSLFEEPVGTWKERKVISSPISIAIVFDNLDMIVIANGPGFHTNAQVHMKQFVYSRESLLPQGKPQDFLKLYNFSPYYFATEMKRKLCYFLMDQCDGLSFDIRSLAWFPKEILVQIALHCSPFQILKLRQTCFKYREALGKDNAQFWKALIKRDFPIYKLERLLESTSHEGSEERYFDKYLELVRFMRRPRRRVPSRIFPIHIQSNFHFF